MPRRLTYDAMTHTYRRGGSVLPGVTSVLHRAGLIDRTWFTADHAARGTAVHDLCQRFDLEGDTSQFRQSVSSEYRGYVDAYRTFTRMMHPKWMTIEQVFFCDRYAGRIDRIGVMLGNQIILDLKTGRRLAWHGIQLAAYDMLVPTPVRRMRLGLYLTKAGKFTLHQYENPSDYATFTAALEA